MSGNPFDPDPSDFLPPSEDEYDDDDNDSNQSDTEKIECTKITVKGKDYLMDENTNIIYHIETHVELGRFNNGLVVFD